MFCTKCGNELKEGSRFCTKCGAPAPVIQQAPTLVQPATREVPTPEPQPIPTEPVLQQAQAMAPIPQAATAQRPKSTNGVMLPMAIIAAVFCLFALIHFISSMPVFRGGLGLFIVLNICAYIVGIATGILSKKQAFLAAIPLPILILANIVELPLMFLGPAPVPKLLSYLANPNYIKMIMRQHKGYVAEFIIAVILLVLFILAAVMKNKAGIIFGAISAAVAVILIVVSVSSLIGPSVRNLMVMKNPRILFSVLRQYWYSFSCIPFYTSYIVLSVGVLIRNIKAAKGKKIA